MPLTAGDIERVTGVEVRDIAVYIEAFTHKSAVGSIGAGRGSYDRLEFLGDSQLSFVVAHHLFTAYPDADEGFLSRMRNQMVSRRCLAGVARRLGLADLVIMNKRALLRGWNHNDRILEDVFEALIAALLQDGGAAAAAAFIVRCIEEHMDLDEIRQHRNFKDELCQYAQTSGTPPPRYRTEVLDGRTYHAFVQVEGHRGRTVQGCGVAPIKKTAQQAAARAALEALGEFT